MKPELLFVMDNKCESIWKDGLWKALKLLEKHFLVTKYNLYNQESVLTSNYDFVLGWGAFGSSVDKFLQDLKCKKGLCIAGNAMPPTGCEKYNILFYETDWYRPFIAHHPNVVKAFGTNTEIYNKQPFSCYKLWDFVTVGAFALWKRQDFMLRKLGTRLAIGEIQRNNPSESLLIIARLLSGGVMVSDMVSPEKLADILNHTTTLYIPSDIYGGGERALLEGLSCGCNVEIEKDNPKLASLYAECDHHIPNEVDYARALKDGILSCL